MDHPQAVFFDCDGTLFDSLAVWEEVDRRFLAERGLPEDPIYLAGLAHCGFASGAAYTIDYFGLPDTADAIMNRWYELAASAYAQDVVFKPGALDYLAHLQEVGVLLGIITALPQRLYAQTFVKAGIEGYFAATFSEVDDQVDKKSPGTYHAAATRFGLAPANCLYYEDTLPALLAAQAAGMQTCAVYDARHGEDWPAFLQQVGAGIKDFAEVMGKIRPVG